MAKKEKKKTFSAGTLNHGPTMYKVISWMTASPY